MSDFQRARKLIEEYKGDRYAFGSGVLSQVGRMAAELGSKAVLIYDVYPGNDVPLNTMKRSLAEAGVQIVGEIQGARPNAPREDLLRIAEELRGSGDDVVVCLGGGSTIDAAKAAEVLRTLGEPVDQYFGVGRVTETLNRTGKSLIPLVAVQTAASTGAHLSKGSNITDYKTGQKKLIVDNAIIPPRAVFDYDLTLSMPHHFIADGALDAFSHMLEVLYDSVGKPYHDRMMQVAEVGITLVVEYLERALENPGDTDARTALGLAADLGGYAVGLGGTNGAHLNSFSLVDVLTHGRACAIMNPYYTVFFAPAVEEPLRMVGEIYRQAGYIDADLKARSGRELGEVVAQGMMAFARRIGFPTTLGEVPGFTGEHKARALKGAKDPQLKMKLEQMPIPMTADTVDLYMGAILDAAERGDLSQIRALQR